MSSSRKSPPNLDLSKPVRTRGGLPATIKSHSIPEATFNLLAEIQFPDGRVELHSYLPNGCFAYGACNSPLDLENVDDSNP